MAVYYNEIEPSAIDWLEGAIIEGWLPPGHIDTRPIQEVEPSDLKGYKRCHFFAGIGGWELALQLAGVSYDEEIWTGSCPCFPAGTRILTSKGFTPIEEVRVGDRVLTHRNNWQKVTHTGSEYSKIIEVKGQGHWGLRTTANHPFYCDGNEWVEAASLEGRKWRSPVLRGFRVIPEWPRKGVSFVSNAWKVVGSLDGKTVYVGRYETQSEAINARREAALKGKIAYRGAEIADVTTAEFAEFLGYWVGDGWVTGSRVVICGGENKLEYMKTLLERAKIRVTTSHEKMVCKKYFQDKNLADWLVENFGKGAERKKIPTWLTGQTTQYREAFLRGYTKADGHVTPNETSWSTVSVDLALGVKLLLNSLLRPASIRRVKTPKTTIIEGRQVRQKDYYRITSNNNKHHWEFSETYGESNVKKVTHTGIWQKVYNLAVQGDESYVADGLIVHNCQPFSSAGRQKGKADDRHLWPVWERLIRECAPARVYGEQVASAVAHGWLDDVYQGLEAEGYAVGAAVLPACSVGKAHRRDRLWFVAKSNSADAGRREYIPSSRGGRLHEERNAEAIGSLAPDNVGNSGCSNSTLGDAQHNGQSTPAQSGSDGEAVQHDAKGAHRASELTGAGASGYVADTCEPGLERYARDEERGAQPGWEQAQPNGPTSQGDSLAWIECPDGKQRPVEPSIRLLVDGLPSKLRKGALHGYGNAIVPEVAAAFIKATL